jgi:hypothetical protein
MTVPAECRPPGQGFAGQTCADADERPPQPFPHRSVRELWPHPEPLRPVEILPSALPVELLHDRWIDHISTVRGIADIMSP